MADLSRDAVRAFLDKQPALRLERFDRAELRVLGC